MLGIVNTLTDYGAMIPLNKISHSLNRVYIEVTNRCNLDCSICIRKYWDDVPGFLLYESYQKLLKDIQNIDPVPEIFFGGYGEPLFHPDIIKMIQGANQIGAKTILISNGTLLSGEMSKAIITAGLNR